MMVMMTVVKKRLATTSDFISSVFLVSIFLFFTQAWAQDDYDPYEGDEAAPPPYEGETGAQRPTETPEPTPPPPVDSGYSGPPPGSAGYRAQSNSADGEVAFRLLHPEAPDNAKKYGPQKPRIRKSKKL